MDLQENCLANAAVPGPPKGILVRMNKICPWDRPHMSVSLFGFFRFLLPRPVLRCGQPRSALASSHGWGTRGRCMARAGPVLAGSRSRGAIGRRLFFLLWPGRARPQLAACGLSGHGGLVASRGKLGAGLGMAR